MTIGNSRIFICGLCRKICKGVRFQELLFFLTPFPVVFLDIYKHKTAIITCVAVLEILALIWSVYGIFKKLKSKERNPFTGLLLYVFAAIVTNLCLLEICQIKYTGLFSDESEKFMLSYFLNNGYKLYDTVFCHHGPVTVMLSHLIYACHPANDIGIFRASGFMVLLLPSALFLFTDIIPRRSIRITAALLFPFSFLLNYFFYDLGMSPLLHGEKFNGIVFYQFFGAVFIGCALILLYPLLFREEYTPRYLFWAGVMLAFSFFCAISFAISIFLIMMMVFLFFIWNFQQAKKKFPQLMHLIYGGCAGTLLIVLYLLIFGSVFGFIDQHILFNLRIYAKYVGMGESISHSFTASILKLPENAFNNNSFYFILLTITVLLSPFFPSARSCCRKRTILHFTFSILIVCAAIFSIRKIEDCDVFTPLTYSGYVILMIAGCCCLSDLSRSAISLVIAFCFWTLLVEKKPQCRISSDSCTFPKLVLKQRQLSSTPLVQSLTTRNDPVLFYSLSFDQYVGEGRLPGKVSFPFLTSWVYEYGKSRLFAEMREVKPVIILFIYSKEFWFQAGPVIPEFLDFLNTMGYKRIEMTPYYILPERCSRQKELAKYLLLPPNVQIHSPRDIAWHPYHELNRSNQYRGKLIYPKSLNDNMVSGVIFRLATYCRSGAQLDGEVKIQFLDRQDKIMYEYVKVCRDIVDNRDYIFPFDPPCRPESVRISSTSTPGKGVTVWINPEDQLNVSAVTGKVSLHPKMRKTPVKKQ